MNRKTEMENKDIFDRIMELGILKPLYPIYHQHKEILLYLFFGGLTFIVSIGSYAFFEISIKLEPLIANIFSWILAVLFCMPALKFYLLTVSLSKSLGRLLLSFQIIL